MSCALENYASTIIGSQTDQCSVVTMEPPATESKKQRPRSRPRVLPDSTHMCPEYVWGDEGPVND
jgi:hypothetical protein